MVVHNFYYSRKFHLDRCTGISSSFGRGLQGPKIRDSISVTFYGGTHLCSQAYLRLRTAYSKIGDMTFQVGVNSLQDFVCEDRFTPTANDETNSDFQILPLSLALVTQILHQAMPRSFRLPVSSVFLIHPLLPLSNATPTKIPHFPNTYRSGQIISRPSRFTDQLLVLM